MVDYLPDPNDPNINQTSQDILRRISPNLKSSDEGQRVLRVIREELFRYEAHARAPTGSLKFLLVAVLALFAGFLIGNGTLS